MFKRKADHILIVKTGDLASFVAAEPYFQAIREAHQDAKISLLTSEHLQRLARAAPYFDQVAAMPSSREPEARKVFIKQLKGEKFAEVFDLSADGDARKLHGGLGPFRPKWHGVSSLRKGEYISDGLPGADKLAASAGLDAPQRLPDFRWALSARKDSANMQPAWFGISGAFGLLLPSLSDDLRWPTEHYAGLAKMMAAAHVMPVLIGGKDLHNFGDEVCHLAPEVVDLSGKTDHLQLTALAQEACFFVSDDSDEVHLAVASGCSGALIKRAGREASSPKDRHVVTLTATGALSDVAPEFVWRTLDNMGLMPTAGEAARRAAH